MSYINLVKSKWTESKVDYFVVRLKRLRESAPHFAINHLLIKEMCTAKNQNPSVCLSSSHQVLGEGEESRLWFKLDGPHSLGERIIINSVSESIPEKIEAGVIAAGAVFGHEILLASLNRYYVN